MSLLGVVKQEKLLGLYFLLLTALMPAVVSWLPGLSVATSLNGQVVVTHSEFTSCLSQFPVAHRGQMVLSLPFCIVYLVLNNTEVYFEFQQDWLILLFFYLWL